MRPTALAVFTRASATSQLSYPRQVFNRPLHAPCMIKFTILRAAFATSTVILALGASLAQSPANTRNAALEQALVHTEFGFFEAWKSKDVAYFRDHVPENGIFLDENGPESREVQLKQQEASAKNCAVEGYSLSDFGLLTVSTGVYLLTYMAEQYATCGAQKAPVHINGSSVYIFKQGRWQAIYRSAIPLKN